MTPEPERNVREKVYAYITQSEQLLVFRHVDFPDAGIQVPGGTVQPGESLRTAVLREAYEETGITGLGIVGELGETWYGMSSICALQHHCPQPGGTKSAIPPTVGRRSCSSSSGSRWRGRRSYSSRRWERSWLASTPGRGASRASGKLPCPGGQQ